MRSSVSAKRYVVACEKLKDLMHNRCRLAELNTLLFPEQYFCSIKKSIEALLYENKEIRSNVHVLSMLYTVLRRHGLHVMWILIYLLPHIMYSDFQKASS